ncbi:SDR family oxidoreductase [Saccharicrinis sp. FJH54]|uniref:SDR family oxidoreductase n=1 Tax=Saccharicrinis sp. FJH54 TaxID=3344665 RepID=UPI0035D488F2
MKIAITGSTGQLGRKVINQLKKRIDTENIVALARNTEKASDLGVQVRLFDYDKPDILKAALNDIDTLLMISASEIGKRVKQHTNVLKAAKEAGIKWIVYTSLLRADTSGINLAGEHVATEKAIMESGIDYTILRHGWYTENYTGALGNALASGTLIGSAGDGKISSATREDFAEAAALVMLDEKNKGRVFEFAGDEAYTLSDLAAEVSGQTGREIPYSNLPEDEYAQVLNQSGIPQGISDAIANWDTSASQGDLYDDTHQLSTVLGRPTTSLSQAVNDALEENK